MFDYKNKFVHVLGSPVGPLGMNQYLVGCPETKEAALIDCGGSPEPFIKMAQEKGWKITKILLTHGHFDHVMGISATVKALRILVYLHPKDRFIYDETPLIAKRYGFHADPPVASTIDLQDGDQIRLGKMKLNVIHVPGHSPGLCVFHIPEAKIVFVGDLIFRGSIGRVDLPGSSPQDMKKSLELAKKLPADTKIFSGHGLSTTLSRELRMNPFLRRR